MIRLGSSLDADVLGLENNIRPLLLLLVKTKTFQEVELIRMCIARSATTQLEHQVWIGQVAGYAKSLNWNWH